jgi:hypothetical protein
MIKVQPPFINVLQVLLNNKAVLIALAISYLIRSGKLHTLQRGIDQWRLLSFIKIRNKP